MMTTQLSTIGGGYRCGSAYCDMFVMVAELRGAVERVDEQGHLMRIPAFRILELADRFGRYVADDRKPPVR